MPYEVRGAGTSGRSATIRCEGYERATASVCRVGIASSMRFSDFQ